MNLQTQEDGAKYQHVLRKVNSMNKDDIVRILNLVLEQEKAEACNGCKYITKDAYDEPCLRCKRNCSDYWRRGNQNV